MAKHKRPTDFDCTIGGRDWRVHFVTRRVLKDRCGDCHWGQSLIRVRYDQPEALVLDTLIHELLHASSEVLYHAEGWVDPIATEFATALGRAGLRLS